MKKLTLMFALQLSFQQLIVGQDVFQRIYNPPPQSFVNLDWYSSLYATDSGYIAAGSINNPNAGATLMRLNTDGSILSNNVYNISPGNILASIDIAPLSDGTFMHNVYEGSNSIFIKTEYSGATLTANKLTPLFSTTVYKQSPKGDFIFGAGRSRSNNVNGGMFCKLDLEGVPVTATFISGPSDRLVTLTHIFETADGNFILSGIRQIYGVPAASEMLIIKTDTVGNLIWSKQLGINATTSLQPVSGIEANDGTLMFIVNNAVGSFTSLLKTDNTGNAIWLKTYNTALNQKPQLFTLKKYGTNDFIAVGSIDSAGSSARPMYMIFDGVGNVSDAKRFTGVSNLISSGNEYDPAKGLLMFGIKDNAANFGYFLFKTDLNLNSSCTSYPISFLQTNTVTTDSAIVYTSTPLALGYIDVGANITINNFTSSDSTLCPSVTGIVSDIEKQLFSLFPNPVNDGVLYINAENITENNFLLRITDATGKEFFNTQLQSGKNSVDVSHLSNGIYFYCLSGSNMHGKGKIILSR